MNFRTDLALEITTGMESDLPGIKQTKAYHGNITIHTIEVLTDEAAQQLSKPKGNYITIDVTPFGESIVTNHEEIVAISHALGSLLPKKGLILIIGLGNKKITPDGIGPLTIEQILSTRHITPELAKASGLDDLRAVAAIAPGVLGQTGIESSEIAHAIAKSVKPAGIIVVDAFACNSIERLGCTIQISDTGISPGSGVANHRKELSSLTLGVPVISIGIPTVIDGLTLAKELYKNTIEEQEIQSLFDHKGASMMVTPREIDLVVERGARVISLAINQALQTNLNIEDIVYLVS
ncbi:MAG: GPR endopeptidase [Oscillospiraceae bacterium]